LLIDRCVFGLLSGRSPVCTGNQPFSLAFQSTANLRRRRSPALPSNSTVDSHRLPDPSGSSPIDLQLAPSTNLRTQLPVDLLTCVSDRPSSSAFQSACDSRRLPIFRPAFQLTSSLRLPINLPAQPSSSLSAFAPSCFPALPSEPNLRLSSAAAFSGCLPTDSRLAP
jgi:hypothetical protein